MRRVKQILSETRLKLLLAPKYPSNNAYNQVLKLEKQFKEGDKSQGAIKKYRNLLTSLARQEIQDTDLKQISALSNEETKKGQEKLLDHLVQSLKSKIEDLWKQIQTIADPSEEASLKRDLELKQNNLEKIEARLRAEKPSINLVSSLVIPEKATLKVLSQEELDKILNSTESKDLGYVDLKGANLQDANLENASLNNTNLENANLENANLQEAFLQNTNLDGANLKNANLTGTILNKTNFPSDPNWIQNIQDKSLRKARLGHVDLSKTNLQGVDFERAHLEEVNLDTDLKDVSLKGVHCQEVILPSDPDWIQNIKDKSLEGANFSGENFENTNFEDVDLTNTNLEFTNLKNANLKNANLQGAKFFRAKLPSDPNWPQIIKNKSLLNARFVRTDLSGVNFQDFNLQSTNLREVNLQNANLQNANLEYSCLDEADLRGANLQDANLKGVMLHLAQLPLDLNWPQTIKDKNLQGVSLTSTNLEGVNFEKVDLGGAYFEKAKLKGANFEGANLQEADFKKTDLREVKLPLNPDALYWANLEGANLSGLDLSIYDLSKTNLAEAILTGTKLPTNYLVSQITKQIQIKELNNSVLPLIDILTSVVGDELEKNSKSKTFEKLFNLIESGKKPHPIVSKSLYENLLGIIEEKARQNPKIDKGSLIQSLNSIKDYRLPRIYTPVEAIRNHKRIKADRNRVSEILNDPDMLIEAIQPSGELSDLVPEWKARLSSGTYQNPIHKFGIDIHTAKVIQNIMNSPEYLSADENSKELLRLAAFLHDIGKATHPSEEDFQEIDHNHSDLSLQLTYQVADRLGLKTAEKDRLVRLIQLKEELNNLRRNNNPLSNYELKKLAFLSGDTDIYHQAVALWKADSQGVKDNLTYWTNNKLDDFTESLFKKLKPFLQQIEESKYTPLNWADDLVALTQNYPTTSYSSDPQKKYLTVMELPQSTNYNFLVHLAHNINDTNRNLDNIEKEGVLSISQWGWGKHRPFAELKLDDNSNDPLVLVLSSSSENIMVAADQNVVSGCGKVINEENLNKLFSEFMSCRSILKEETEKLIKMYLPEHIDKNGEIKNLKNLRDAFEYYSRTGKITEGFNSFTQRGNFLKIFMDIQDLIINENQNMPTRVIKPIDDKESAISKHTASKLHSKRDFIFSRNNELVVYKPEIKAVMVRKTNPNQELKNIIRPEIEEFCREKGLPIIVVNYYPQNSHKSKRELSIEKTKRRLESEAAQSRKWFENIQSMPNYSVLNENIGGSTGAKLIEYEDKSGNRIKAVLKTTADGQIGRDHLMSEYLTNKIYELMGFDIPQIYLFEKEGDLYQVSKFMENSTEIHNGYLNNLSVFERHLIIEKIQAGFALDALLGNWDIMKNDNIKYDAAARKLYRLDNGGSLFFRARGRKKDDFGNDVFELSSMRADYYGISDAEISKQIIKIKAMKPRILELLPPNQTELKQVLSNRIDSL